VHVVTASAIQMDRVDGPTMLDQLAKHPDQASPFGRVLAELHEALDRTGAAESALVHGDLHPGNVLMSTGGSVLIDWTNHRLGPRALDLALTWLVLECFDPGDDVFGDQFAPVKVELLSSFLTAVDAAAAAARMPEAAAIRRADPATTPGEHFRIDQLLSRCGH
jgi:aminoglycoside phosphotransferase (APT) family kinase protein